MSPATTTAAPTAPVEEPKAEKTKGGRIVRNAFAVALSDACEVFDGVPEQHRGLLLDNLTALYRPADPVAAFDTNDPRR